MAAAGGLAVAATLLSGSVAEAATFTVANANASGAGSLSDAITQANSYGASHSGAESTIVFQSGLTGSINLTSALPEITELLYIHGPGADKLTINGEHARGIFNIDVTDVPNQSLSYATTISGLTLTGGEGFDNPTYGGAIWGRSSVVLQGDTISDSSADDGGGVLVAEPYGLWVIDSTITGNTATSGGGIFSGGNLVMNDSTISGNTATAGGGIYQGHGYATIVGSTIAENHAASSNCITLCTGGGINFGSIPNVRSDLRDTIVAENTATGGPDVFVPQGLAVTSKLPTASFSLIGDTSASRLTTDGTDITGRDPQLGPLGHHGGPTETMLPADTSPVIDAGSAFGLISDQRGIGRPIDLPGYPNAAGGDGTDIGAVELQPAEVLPIIHGLSVHTAPPGTPIVITGSRLGPATAVRFGSLSVPFVAESDTKITTWAPLSTGLVTVRVVSPGGQSAAGVGTGFRFQPVRPRTIQAAFQNLRFKITAPPYAACVAPAGRLPIGFSRSSFAGGSWRLSTVGFYIDQRQQPAGKLDGDGSVRLSVAGLKQGNHTLRVAATAARGPRRHTTTASLTFLVC